MRTSLVTFSKYLILIGDISTSPAGATPLGRSEILIVHHIITTQERKWGFCILLLLWYKADEFDGLKDNNKLCNLSYAGCVTNPLRHHIEKHSLHQRIHRHPSNQGCDQQTHRSNQHKEILLLGVGSPHSRSTRFPSNDWRERRVQEVPNERAPCPAVRPCTK